MIVDVIFIVSYMACDGSLCFLRVSGSVILLDLGLQPSWVSALARSQLCTIAVKNERRHRANTLPRCRLRALVDVHFEEHSVGILGRQLLENWCYSLAGTAPKHIQDNNVVISTILTI